MTKSLPEYLNNVVQCTRSLREVLRQAAALAVWAAPLGALADVLARVWPWPLRRPLVGLDDMEHAVGQVCDAVNSLTDAVREVLGGIPDHLTDQERVVVIAEVIILILFQDETNNATLSSWQDREESMSSWSHLHGGSCSKLRTSGNSGKPWRCCSQRS